ncbi:MAG: hypothetical protein QOJ23_2497 [Actinomycetota bacterium]|jgi:hypothetical protein|nr:hypothetical protein [Actinomycetota bacterium]
MPAVGNAGKGDAGIIWRLGGEARASRARSECQQYAKLQKLKGSARDNYVKQCVWASD